MESYRPGAPAMTCRVLRGGGRVARVRSGRLCCRCGFIVAASEAGDEGDLLRTGSARARPRLRARLRLGPRGRQGRLANTDRAQNLRKKEEVNSPLVGIVRRAVSSGITEIKDGDLSEVCSIEMWSQKGKGSEHVITWEG